MAKKGALIVFSGPSGCGKGTILKAYQQKENPLYFSVSATTRSPREGEVDGVHYYFVTKEEFEEKIQSDGMLEYASYVGNYYGTPRQAVEEKRNEGYDVVLEIEVQGALQVKKSCPDATMIFVLPPSLSVLEERLTKRGTESPETIARRLAMAKEEMKKAPLYDYIIVNGELEKAVEDFGAILQSNRLKAENQKDILEEVLRYDA